MEAHAAITQHRKQVQEDTAKAEAGKRQHLDILGSGQWRRQLRRRSWSDGARDRNRAQIVLQSSLSRAALDVCEATAPELLGAIRSVARNDTTFSRSCLSARPGNIILTPGTYRRGALR